MGLTWLQFYADPKNQLGAKDRDQNRSEAKTFPIPDHLLNGQDLRFPIEKDPSKGIITLISAFLGFFFFKYWVYRKIRDHLYIT